MKSKCYKCQKLKPLTSFHKSKNTKNGVKNICKSCRTEVWFNKKNIFQDIPEIDGEIWKDIPSYEGYYQASNLGRIKSVVRFSNGRVRKSVLRKLNRYGKREYLYVILIMQNQKKLHTVHRLIAETFIGKIENNKVVNHIDFNGSNNKLSNLEIVNVSENSTYSIPNKKKQKTSKYTGVYYSNKQDAWISCIFDMDEKVTKTLGVFDTEEQAALSYKNAFKKRGVPNKYGIFI